jgi:hypothetical protein
VRKYIAITEAVALKLQISIEFLFTFLTAPSRDTKMDYLDADYFIYNVNKQNITKQKHIHKK